MQVLIEKVLVLRCSGTECPLHAFSNDGAAGYVALVPVLCVPWRIARRPVDGWRCSLWGVWTAVDGHCAGLWIAVDRCNWLSMAAFHPPDYYRLITTIARPPSSRPHSGTH